MEKTQTNWLTDWVSDWQSWVGHREASASNKRIVWLLISVFIKSSVKVSVKGFAKVDLHWGPALPHCALVLHSLWNPCQGSTVYGVVWCGFIIYPRMVWYGMVWFGMVWYGMVWYGMVWYGRFPLAVLPAPLTLPYSTCIHTRQGARLTTLDQTWPV